MSAGFWFNYALALIIIGLMLAGFAIVARSLARGRVLASARHRLVTVLESTALSQHAALHVVKVGARYLLVAGSQGSVRTLAELPRDEVEGWLAQQHAAGGVSLSHALRLMRGRNGS
jgi:flagellar biogenesis protein FliO